MAEEAKINEPSFQDRIYRELRQKIMLGDLTPGQSLTLRGVAESYEVSMTPAREVLRRLAAEGALIVTNTGRFMTPILSNDRLEELAALRGLLEPEIAARALPRAHLTLIDRLQLINSRISQAVIQKEPISYVQANLEFHRSLYLRAQAPAILALVENIWLQIGPTMRNLYEKVGVNETPVHHLSILAALKSGNESELRLMVRTDVTKGLRMLTR
ncbi:MAG: GntR family transcriptional regulator [Rhodobacteraceae bacterium]|jgi:DNA-binding GntR family transcriptional regulator|nr:GntR family transcriptional regulator [Paracoccaceae bacterium]MAT00739.1 GntR family transcriptional regulator [Paracoccaceae bacterium]MBL6855172.1 GntR family transcriptional regulator [Paracoccaceae bacterium]MBV03913.1 GntR family transcriptional regulator [Paracoccaceae bacterium]MDG1879463.1 GntR family transcriptional regulator [Paracoccaceae bacterium]|tara:strand:+ start:1908 stop:2552 length:645 start_codon:yes stop_codon:yes gene_type:complete